MAHTPVRRKPTPGPGIKGVLLGFFAISMLPVGIAALFRGDLKELFLASLAFFLILGAAWFTRRGLVATAEYHKRRLAVAPPPYRAIGLLLATLASFAVAFFLNNYNLIESLAFAALTALGYYLYYDLDPRKEKLVEGLAGYSTVELMQVINEANTRIADIERESARLGQAELTPQINRIVVLANDIMEILEKKPLELRRARKFMNVYLDGAREVTVGYARMFDKTTDAKLHSNFREVLGTIEKAFIEQRDKLLANDVLDLDIQIEVLKKQMEN